MKSKHWLIVVVLALIFSGCSSNVPKNNTKKIEDKTVQGQNPLGKEVQNEKEEIYYEKIAVKNIDKHTDILIEYPQVKNMKSLEIEKKINGLFKEKAISDYGDEDVDGLNLPMTTKVEYFNSNMISVKYSGYGYYYGAANGNDIMYATNINLNTGEIIDIRNLFTDRFQEKLNRNVFKYYGPDKASEGEAIDPNSYEYGYMNADDSIITEMFNNFNSNKEVDKYYFSEKSFNIITETPSGPTAYLELQLVIMI